MKNRARYMRVRTGSVFLIRESITDINKRQFEVLRQCVKDLGQLQPLVVREIGNGEYEAIDGNARLIILKDLGIDKVDVLDLGKISDEFANELHIILNMNKGKAKPVHLTSVMEKIVKADPGRQDGLLRKLPLKGKSVSEIVEKIRKKVGKKKSIPHNPSSQPSFVDFRMRVPPDAAKICDKALHHIEKNHGVKRSRAFELMAADYLNNASVHGGSYGP